MNNHFSDIDRKIRELLSRGLNHEAIQITEEAIRSAAPDLEFIVSSNLQCNIQNDDALKAFETFSNCRSTVLESFIYNRLSKALDAIGELDKAIKVQEVAFALAGDVDSHLANLTNYHFKNDSLELSYLYRKLLSRRSPDSMSVYIKQVPSEELLGLLAGEDYLPRLLSDISNGRKINPQVEARINTLSSKDMAPILSKLHLFLCAADSASKESLGLIPQNVLDAFGISGDQLMANCRESLIASKRPAASGDIDSYKVESIREGRMCYKSPLSGLSVSAFKSIVLPRGGIAYLIIEGEVAYYAMECMSSGGLGGFYFPSYGLILGFKNLRHITYSVKQLICQLLLNYTQIVEYFNAGPPCEMALISGVYAHLAHTFYNEYPPYLALEALDLIKNRPVLTGPSYYLKVSELTRRDDLRQQFFDSNLALSQFIIASNMLAAKPSVTAYTVSKGIKASLECIANTAGNDICIERDIHDPVVWFEIRSNDRICVNQIDVCKSVVSMLLEKFASPKVLVAGWSLPPVPSMHDMKYIDRDREIASSLVKFSKDTVVPLIGLTLSQKLAYSSFCSAFITGYGGGTMFSVLHDRPMLLHTNHGWINSCKSALLRANPMLSSAKVYVVNPLYIEDDSEKIHFHTRNYKCDPDGLVSNFEELLRVC